MGGIEGASIKGTEMGAMGEEGTEAVEEEEGAAVGLGEAAVEGVSEGDGELDFGVGGEKHGVCEGALWILCNV